MEVENAAAAGAGGDEVDEAPEEIVFEDHVMRLAFHPSASVIAASSVPSTPKTRFTPASGSLTPVELATPPAHNCLCATLLPRRCYLSHSSEAPSHFARQPTPPPL